MARFLQFSSWEDDSDTSLSIGLSAACAVISSLFILVFEYDCKLRYSTGFFVEMPNKGGILNRLAELLSFSKDCLASVLLSGVICVSSLYPNRNLTVPSIHPSISEEWIFSTGRSDPEGEAGDSDSASMERSSHSNSFNDSQYGSPNINKLVREVSSEIGDSRETQASPVRISSKNIVNGYRYWVGDGDKKFPSTLPQNAVSPEMHTNLCYNPYYIMMFEHYR